MSIGGWRPWVLTVDCWVESFARMGPNGRCCMVKRVVKPVYHHACVTGLCDHGGVRSIQDPHPVNPAAGSCNASVRTLTRACACAPHNHTHTQQDASVHAHCFLLSRPHCFLPSTRRAPAQRHLGLCEDMPRRCLQRKVPQGHDQSVEDLGQGQWIR